MSNGTLRHKKVSTKPDKSDTSKVLASEWGSTSTDYATNPTHEFSGGATGSLLFRDAGQTDGVSWLAAVPAGSYLRSAGVAAAIVWSTLTLPNSATAGDLFVASAANAMGSVAAVAPGQVLASAGVGVAPAWTATPSVTSLTLATPLAPASGGTGLAATFAVGDLLYASGAAAMSKLAAVAVGQVLVSGGVTTAPAWSASPTLTSVVFSGGSVLEGSVANVLEQRNGTTAQFLRVYNTFTNASNYERGGVGWNANSFQIGTFNAGTGQGRGLQFVVGNVGKMSLSAAGDLVFDTDNANDIGTLTGFRPRTGYFATSVVCAGSNGQAINTLKQLTELTTIAAAASTDTTIQLPANAVILAVTVRTTVVIPTATSYSVGDSGSATRFNTANVGVAATSTDPGTKAGAYYNATALSVRLTMNGGTPAANTGRVRVTIFYYDVTPATS